MKILFVTTRNIVSTCGELRLIKSRAIAMRDYYKIDTVFYSYISQAKLNSDSNDNIDKEFEVDYTTFNRKLPHTYFKNTILFNNKVLQRIKDDRSIKVVIISGIMNQNLLRKIKEFDKNIKIILDIHGAHDELLEFSSKKRKLLSWLLYIYINKNLKNQIKYADAIIVVSEALKEYIIKKYRDAKKLEYFIIGCGSNYKKIDVNKYEINRKAWREELKISKDECLFIYSGGISKWQMIHETIEIYLNIKSKLPFKSKLLVMSHMIDKLKSQLNFSTDDIIFASYKADEVKSVLCAGDFAFMLREDKITNNVAFPNKFIEYILSGNQVISTPYIYDISKLIKDYDVGLLYHDNIETLKEQIIERFNKHKNLTGHNYILNKTAFINTTRQLCRYISDDY